jgi:hypothetical protein
MPNIRNDIQYNEPTNQPKKRNDFQHPYNLCKTKPAAKKESEIYDQT